MSSISSIIEVYQMKELTPNTRARIMAKLGQAINYEYSSNLTEDLVAELVRTLPVNKSELPEVAGFLGDRWL